jgi:hypothetical protein
VCRIVKASPRLPVSAVSVLPEVGGLANAAPVFAMTKRAMNIDARPLSDMISLLLDSQPGGAAISSLDLATPVAHGASTGVEYDSA